MGSETKEADLIVYMTALKAPLIVVECEGIRQRTGVRRAWQAVKLQWRRERATFGSPAAETNISRFRLRSRKAGSPFRTCHQCGVTALARFKFAKDGGTTKTDRSCSR